MLSRQKNTQKVIKKLTKFGLMLLVAQALSAAAALFLTQKLPIHSYAQITIFLITQGAANILASGATALILSAKIGVAWGDNERIAVLLAYANKLQKISMSISIPILCVIAGVQYRKAGADLSDIFILSGILIFVISVEQSGRLRAIVINFNGDQAYTQSLDLLSAAIRVGAVVLLDVFEVLGIQSALVAYGVAGIPRLFFIRRKSFKIINPETKFLIDNNTRIEMNKFVMRHIANDVFICAQPQLTLLATTQYASVNVTAGLGALSRIGQLFSPLYVAIAAYLIPYFSKKKNNIQTVFFLIVLIGAVPAILLLLFSATIPTVLLSLLGSNYFKLTNELLIAASGFAIYAWLNFCWQLLLNRGHNKYAWTNIPSAMVCGLMAFFLVDKGTLEGALLIQLSMSASLIIPVGLEIIDIIKSGIWSESNEG